MSGAVSHDQLGRAHRLRSIAERIDGGGLAAAIRVECGTDAALAELIGGHFASDAPVIVSQLRRRADEIASGAGRA